VGRREGLGVGRAVEGGNGGSRAFIKGEGKGDWACDVGGWAGAGFRILPVYPWLHVHVTVP
jgi:hypothetical protein